MRAIIVDHGAPGHLRAAEVPEPTPRPDEAVIEVDAASVNPADRHAIDAGADGTVVGYEASGVVVAPAADGSGPPAGARVSSIAATGAWAERRAAPTRLVGRLPDAVDATTAATLPIAGGSALRALHVIGPLLGRRVLVTGATGAVGAFAVQLAALGGADVIATGRDPGRHAWLRDLGAGTVVGAPDEIDGAVDGVVDTIGGEVLAEAFRRLAEDGRIVSVGRASGHDTVLHPGDLLADWSGSRRSIHTFFLLDGTPGLDRDFGVLARLVADGRLRAHVDRVEDLETGAALVADGTPTGKLVLRLR